MLLYLDPELKIALKKAALDRRCHAYEIVEELVRDHLVTPAGTKREEASRA